MTKPTENQMTVRVKVVTRSAILRRLRAMNTQSVEQWFRCAMRVYDQRCQKAKNVARVS